MNTKNKTVQSGVYRRGDKETYSKEALSSSGRVMVVKVADSRNSSFAGRAKEYVQSGGAKELLRTR